MIELNKTPDLTEEFVKLREKQDYIYARYEKLSKNFKSMDT